MKTGRWFNLRGWFKLATGVAFGAMLCASAYAGPGATTVTRESAPRPHQAQAMPAGKNIQIYIMTSASAIPKPISYVNGGVVTTAIPIEIIGRGQTIVR
jgi:hypothetical protein